MLCMLAIFGRLAMRYMGRENDNVGFSCDLVILCPWPVPTRDPVSMELGL